MKLFAERPLLLATPIVLDLNDFPPNKEVMPIYGKDVDVLVKGHDTEWRTGRTMIRGGRRVHGLGGAFKVPFECRGQQLSTTFEGIVYDGPGDAFPVYPSRSSFRPALRIFGCGAFNIDGFNEGLHGDALQVSPNNRVKDFASFDTIVVEKFSITTGFQGLKISVDNYDEEGVYPVRGPVPSFSKFTEIDIQKTKRCAARNATDPNGGGIGAIWLIDPTSERFTTQGDRPYPKAFREVYVQPYADEGLIGSLGPNGKYDYVLINGVKVKCAPIISADGKTASWDPRLLVNGVVKLGRPPGGSFVPQVTDAIGGVGIAGRGYRPLDRSRISA